MVGSNFYLEIDNQVYLLLTVAYFLIDSFFFFCLTVSRRGNRKICNISSPPPAFYRYSGDCLWFNH